MKTKIKQGELYLYKKSETDWAVVMAHATFPKRLDFHLQVLEQSKECSLKSVHKKPSKKGDIDWFYISDFTHLPNCKLSFTCKTKPTKEDLVVYGEVVYEKTTKRKKK